MARREDGESAGDLYDFDMGAYGNPDWGKPPSTLNTVSSSYSLYYH